MGLGHLHFLTSAIQGHPPPQSHSTRRICPGWTEKKKRQSRAEGCKMSCGNESALWDIIQFLLDKIHHPLGTHLPLRQETPKISRSLRDLQNLVLPTRGGAPWGDIEGRLQMKSVELRNIWKKQREVAGLFPVAAACDLVLVPGVFQTFLENIPAAQYSTLRTAQGKRCRMSSGSNLL